MKLYPFDLPEGVHPEAWTLLGFGLSVEQLQRLSKHLFDDLGVQVPQVESKNVEFKWSVGVDKEGYTRLEVGDEISEVIGGGAVRISDGAPPPGIRLDKSTKTLSGTLTHTGVFSVTVTIGPTVKYDPLGSPGGPNDPGMWIPIDQPRQETVTTLSAFPTTVEDLSAAEKDRLLAELMAERDGRTIKEADNGD